MVGDELLVAVGTALPLKRLGPPPAQIPACAANALGSCLGYKRRSASPARDGPGWRTLPLDVHGPVHLTRLGSGAASGACFAVPCSPWPGPFPPPPPLPEFWLCSAASQVLRACPTSHGRSSSDCGLGLPDAARGTISPQAVVGSPGSRAWRFRTCRGSPTARGPQRARASAPCGVAFRFV